MRILFSSLATHGHAYPLIPLAVAAARAGHEVRFATAAMFHPVLTGLGLAVDDAGTDMRTAFAAELPEGTTFVQMRERYGPEEMRRRQARVFGDLLPRRFATDLVPLIERFRADLVIQELGNPGAGIAASAAGVPALVHGFGRVDPANRPMSTDALAAVAADFGVTLAQRPVLDICPPSLQDPGFLAATPRIPLRPELVAEPGPAVDYRAGTGRPLVYLTLGTAMGSVPLLRRAIDGLATLEADVLVAAGPVIDTSALGAVPPNVTVREWVRHADLLAHVDLAVHHGGSGTTLGVLTGGAPQVFVPQGADQFTNAAAVADLGAGITLPADADGAAFADAARTALDDPAYRAAASALAAEAAALPSAEHIAATLPDHVT